MKNHTLMILLAVGAIGFAQPVFAQEEPAQDESVQEEPAQEEPVQQTGAVAEQEVTSDHPAATNNFVLAPHIGAIFPQLTSDLETWPIFGLGAGYILPFDVGSMERPLQLGLDLMYTQPSASGTEFAPELGEEGSEYDWELTQQMLILELEALWRFMPPGEFISAYGLLGPRVYFMNADMEASGNGQDFGPNEETNTEYGLVFGGGVDFAVGPGTIFANLEFGWSDLDQRITGDSNTGAVVIDAGYRLYLF